MDILVLTAYAIRGCWNTSFTTISGKGQFKLFIVVRCVFISSSISILTAQTIDLLTRTRGTYLYGVVDDC